MIGDSLELKIIILEANTQFAIPLLLNFTAITCARLKYGKYGVKIL